MATVLCLGAVYDSSLQVTVVQTIELVDWYKICQYMGEALSWMEDRFG